MKPAAALLEKRIKVAAGVELADCVIKNGKIINVFTGEVETGDIAIVDGYFAGIGNFEGKETIDANGKYVSPAFIDGHVHIESTMISPAEFAKVQVLHGVTTVITDPHEIANVKGAEGIQYMLDATEDIPFDAYFMLPSCVPATAFEQSGANLEAQDLYPFYQHPRVLGLAEVMNYPAVLNADPSMLDKLLDAQNLNKKIDGHAAGLSPQSLDVYMAAGIRTDHECTTIEEAKVRLRKGMYLMIREGTIAKDLLNLIGVVNPSNSRRCLFVTDDRHLDDVYLEGSIDHNVRLAIREGIPELTAYQMATINTAECFGLKEHGAIAAGYKADFLLLDQLSTVEISTVYKNGQKVMDQGEIYGFPAEQKASARTGNLKKSVQFKELKEEDFTIKFDGDYANIIGVIPNSLITNHVVEKVEKEDNGVFKTSGLKDHLKIAVIERHHHTGSIGLGIVKGLGLQSGAIATTVAHDSHNLIVAGMKDEDILVAAEEMKKMQGGLIVVNEGKTLATLELPIAGLMSEAPFPVVLEQLKDINQALSVIGASQEFNPFLTLAFLALPVIPKLKITDKGLFNIVTFKYIPIEA